VRQGKDFAALHVPGTTLEPTIASLAPRTGYDDGVTHAGIDVLVVAEGELVVVDCADDPLCERDCAVWPSSHPLTVRNDSATPPRGDRRGDRGLLSVRRRPWRR